MQFHKETFDEVITGAVELKNFYFQDLWFISSRRGNAFKKAVSVRTTSLKFSLRDVEYLHLASIRIGVDRNGARSYMEQYVSANILSRWGDSTTNFTKIFDFENFEICFHTDLSEPTLILTFPESDVCSIEINNRGDANACRAWSLYIEALHDEDWKTIYESKERAKEYRNLLAERFYDAGPVAEEIIDLCIMAFQCHPNLESKIKQFAEKNGDAAMAYLRDMINQKILSTRKLQITAHGLSRTFKFWPLDEMSQYMKLANTLAEDLTRAGWNTFLGFGTLLGLVREGRFILHDDDIDLISIVNNDREIDLVEHVDNIKSTLIKLGYQVPNTFYNHFHVFKDNNDHVIDVFIAINKEGQLLLNPAKDPSISLCEIEPLSNVFFYGSQCKIPHNPLLMLEKIYGANWRTPLIHFAHDWRENLDENYHE